MRTSTLQGLFPRASERAFPTLLTMGGDARRLPRERLLAQSQENPGRVAKVREHAQRSLVIARIRLADWHAGGTRSQDMSSIRRRSLHRSNALTRLSRPALRRIKGLAFVACGMQQVPAGFRHAVLGPLLIRATRGADHSRHHHHSAASAGGALLQDLVRCAVTGPDGAQTWWWAGHDYPFIPCE